jgi:D-sedoheptulose 7-phosphate isomerase
MSTYCFDIDNYCCKTEGSDYPNAIPIKEVIEAINRLYGKGHYIKMFTGRGIISAKDWKEYTIKQLDQWGLKYNELIMGKPHYDFIGDDKMITVQELLRDETLESCLVAEIVKAFKNGKKVLVFGNGGLCAEASHFATELMGKYGADIYLPAIALADNSSLITAIGNDFGFEYIFSHQVEVLGKKGDILIGMTTSQSKNIVKALMVGKEGELVTVVICGMKSEIPFADYKFKMFGNDTAEIQNETIKFLHRIAFEVKRVYGN